VFYVLETGQQADDAELREWLAQRVPRHLVPQRFARLDRLPRTPNGKVDRRALAALDPGPPSSRAPATPPETSTERTLAAIWRDVLQLDTVGRDDDFFELGGHSILATRTAVRVARALGRDVPVRLFFDVPRLSDLAARLDAIETVSRTDPDRAGAAATQELVF
jgi:hypothetical protein